MRELAWLLAVHTVNVVVSQVSSSQNSLSSRAVYVYISGSTMFYCPQSENICRFVVLLFVVVVVVVVVLRVYVTRSCSDLTFCVTVCYQINK